MRVCSIMFAFASVSSGAFGRGQGVGTWIWDVATQSGDAIVEPGETATVSLWMDMAPSVGDQLPDGYFVGGFGAGIVDVIGGANADKGRILGWDANPTLQFLVGPTGTTDGVSIFDVELVQIPPELFDTSDPIFLFSFEWEPEKFGSYEAAYTPLIEEPLVNPMPGFYIWKTTDGNDAMTEHWRVEPAEIVISVVPAPPASAPLVLSGLCVAQVQVRTQRLAGADSGAAGARRVWDPEAAAEHR